MTNSINPALSAHGGTLFSLNPQQWSFLLALVVLNFFVFWALRRVTLKIELKEILAEKDPTEVTSRANAMVAAVAQAEKVAQVVAAQHAAAAAAAQQVGQQNIAATPELPEQPKIPDPVPTSSSRTASFLGTIVLVGALWAFANFAVWAAFWNPAALTTGLDAFGRFFLAGSALFAPYAFNQLGTIFRGRA